MVVAGLLAAARVSQKKMSEMRYVFFGAGGAGIGIASSFLVTFSCVVCLG